MVGGARKGAAKAAKGYACSVRRELSSLILYERDPGRCRRGRVESKARVGNGLEGPTTTGGEQTNG